MYVLVTTNEISEEREAESPNFPENARKTQKGRYVHPNSDVHGGLCAQYVSESPLKGSNPFPYGNKRFGIFFGFTLRKSILHPNYLTFCQQNIRHSRKYNEIAPKIGAICSGHLFCPDIMVRRKGLEPPTLGTGIRCSIH